MWPVIDLIAVTGTVTSVSPREAPRARTSAGSPDGVPAGVGEDGADLGQVRCRTSPGPGRWPGRPRHRSVPGVFRVFRPWLPRTRRVRRRRGPPVSWHAPALRGRGLPPPQRARIRPGPGRRGRQGPLRLGVAPRQRPEGVVAGKGQGRYAGLGGTGDHQVCIPPADNFGSLADGVAAGGARRGQGEARAAKVEKHRRLGRRHVVEHARESARDSRLSGTGSGPRAAAALEGGVLAAVAGAENDSGLIGIMGIDSGVAPGLQRRCDPEEGVPVEAAGPLAVDFGRPA